MIKDVMDIHVKNISLTTYPTENQNYDIGILISKRWSESVHRTGLVNGRI